MTIKILNVLYVKLMRFINSCSHKKTDIFVGLLTFVFLSQIRNITINIILLILTPIIAYFSFYISHLFFYQKTFHNLRQILKEPIKTYTVFRIFLYALFEEILFRGIVQVHLWAHLKNNIVAISVSTIIFVIFHFNKKRSFCYTIDIVLFSILITLLFHYFQDLISTVLIHTIRNILIEKHNINITKKNRDNIGRLKYR